MHFINIHLGPFLKSCPGSQSWRKPVFSEISFLAKLHLLYTLTSRWMLHKIWYIYITFTFFTYILRSKVLMTLILNQWYYARCNFTLKYYITVSFRQFMWKLKIKFFNLSRANGNLEICMLIDLCHWIK